MNFEQYELDEKFQRLIGTKPNQGIEWWPYFRSAVSQWPHSGVNRHPANKDKFETVEHRRWLPTEQEKKTMITQPNDNVIFGLKRPLAVKVYNPPSIATLKKHTFERCTV